MYLHIFKLCTSTYTEYNKSQELKKDYMHIFHIHQKETTMIVMIPDVMWWYDVCLSLVGRSCSCSCYFAFNVHLTLRAQKRKKDPKGLSWHALLSLSLQPEKYFKKGGQETLKKKVGISWRWWYLVSYLFLVTFQDKLQYS